MKDDVSSYIDEIINALDEDAELSREEIEREFRKFLEYGVPLEQAKKSLIKRFGGDKTNRKFLKDVKPNEKNLYIVCKVLTKRVKDIISSEGENKTIYYGLLADETAILPFTSWKSSFPADKGDVIEIRNAYSREWQGNVQINIGNRTTIKKLEKSEMEIVQEPKTCKLIDLHKTFGPIEVKVKIADISKKEVEIDGEKKVVFSGLLADETGKARFTAWHDFGLNKGDSIKISNCYARFWKGIPQIVFDERSKVEKLSEDIKMDFPILPIHKLVEMKGGIDVTVEGTIIDIKNGSGYIERCPECNRLMKNGECKIHGKIKGVSDLRLKMVVDDGFASIGVIVSRELTEKLIGKNLKECKEIVEREGNDKLLEMIRKDLISRKVRLKGNALGDEFGTTMIAKDIEILEVDVKKEAENLLSILEGEK